MRGLLLTLLIPALAMAGSEDFPEKVRQGIEHFQAGRYDSAATAFAEAGEARPEDPRIAFDRGCAYAAQGDVGRAVEMFQRAALAPDRGLSARSHYNLGNVAADEARKEFGESPEEAAPAIRQEGLKSLAQAIGHYRDCLRIDPGHEDARHNLELLRIWIDRMEQIWKERDRHQDDRKESLLERIEEIQRRQRAMRMKCTGLAAEPDSSQRREVAGGYAESQQSLAADLEPIKEEISREFQDGLGALQADGEEKLSGSAEQAELTLRRLVDQTAEEMADAADALRDGEPAEARRFQTAAVEKLNELFLAVVPFSGLVQKAIQTEEQLVESGKAAEGPLPQREVLDFGEAAWDQRFVAGWSEVLPEKAEGELAQLSAIASQPAEDDGDSSNGSELAEIKKQAAAMAKAMEKAIEFGPKIAKLTGEAADHLEQQDLNQALPKQEEALKLLKELLPPPPEQPQGRNQDRQPPSGKDEESGKQDEEKQKPDSQDGPQQEDKQQPMPQDSQPEESQPEDEPQTSESRQQENVSQQEAEAMIRQVRDRQRQRRELEKQSQGRFSRPAPLDKDW